MMPTQVPLVAGAIADPELRFAASGKAWVTVRCVTKDRKKDSNGNWTDGDPWFYDVLAFGKLAEHIADSVTKGDTLIVIGRFEQRAWETQGGDKRTELRVIAEAVGLSLQWKAYPVGSGTESVSARAATEPAGRGQGWVDNQQEEAPF